MSGDVGSRGFLALCYGAVVLLLLISAGLLLCNADQLVSGDGLFAGGLLSDPAFWRSLNLSLVTATITSLTAALVGIPAAYVLSRYKGRARGVIDVLLSSVIVLPASSVGLCLIVLFQYGPLFWLQQTFGFQVAHSVLPGIVVAQLVLSLAMGLSAWRAAFDGVNPRFELVARSLGGSSWHAFRTVTLPLARSGLLAGFILAWVRAFAEFGAVLLFCATFAELPQSRFSSLLQGLQLHKADILPVSMWTHIEYGQLEYGFGVAFILVLVSTVSVYLMHRLGGRGYVW